MKSTLSMDAKDLEENILLIEKQIQILLSTSSSTSLFNNLQRSNSTTSSLSTNLDNLQTNYYKAISTTA
jgi:hypothetical protein